MIFGEERLFIIEYPGVPAGLMEFFLRFVGEDKRGLKLRGIFPKVWTTETPKISGPLLCDENIIYEVTTVDYDNHLIWLRPVVNSLA